MAVFGRLRRNAVNGSGKPKSEAAADKVHRKNLGLAMIYHKDKKFEAAFLHLVDIGNTCVLMSFYVTQCVSSVSPMTSLEGSFKLT